MTSVESILSKKFNDQFESLLQLFKNHITKSKSELLDKLNNFINKYNDTKSLNPRIFILIWKSYITNKYSNEINNNDIKFLLNKDFQEDIPTNDYTESIFEIIEHTRTCLKNISENDQLQIMQILNTLNNIAKAYNNK